MEAHGQFNNIAHVASNDRLEKLLNSVAINQYLTWHDHIDQLETWGLKRELNVYLFAQGRFLSRRWSSPILLSKSIV